MMPGNPVVGGVALRRPAIQSPNYVHGSAGWTVNADGSAEFNNLTIRGTFNGNNFILNSSGLFIYSGTPAAGNLIASSAGAAGTDSFGNAYVQGDGVYITISGTKYILTFGQQNSLPAMSIQQASGGPVLPVIYGAAAAASTGCSSYVNSGQSTVAAVASVIQAEDSVFSGVANGQISLQAGLVSLGQSGACNWGDNNQSFSLPAGGGPFISGESFHTLSNPSGITGTARIKKLPWNAIWFEGDVTWSGTTGTTLTFGAPPDSSYSPANSIRRPVASTGIPSALSAAPRLFIPSGGTGPQLITQTVTAANSQYGWSVIYPTN